MVSKGRKRRPLPPRSAQHGSPTPQTLSSPFLRDRKLHPQRSSYLNPCMIDQIRSTGKLQQEAIFPHSHAHDPFQAAVWRRSATARLQSDPSKRPVGGFPQYQHSITHSLNRLSPATQTRPLKFPSPAGLTWCYGAPNFRQLRHLPSPDPPSTKHTTLNRHPFSPCPVSLAAMPPAAVAAEPTASPCPARAAAATTSA
jgi:hypothetical protein